MKQKIKQLLQKQFKLTTVFIITAIVSLFWIGYYAEPDDLVFSERSTYDYQVNEVSPIMTWMSVDWEAGEFWYTDQLGHYYVKGTVEETGENHYWFRCDYEESKAIIPDQLMTRYNNDEITLMIGDEIRRFAKSEEQIVTIGNYEYK